MNRLCGAVVALSLAASPVAATPATPVPAVNVPAITQVRWNGSTLHGWFTPYRSDVEVVKRRGYSAFRATAYNPPRGRNLQVVALPGGGSAIRIITRRHCTKSWTTPLVAGFQRARGENEYRTACPRGTITRYSTGRIQSPNDLAVPVAGARIEGRVKLPANAVRGVRFAFWAVTDGDVDGQPPAAGYCTAEQPSTDLLEADILEWYGGRSNRNRAHLGDHVGCQYPLGSNQVHVAANGGKNWVNGWHVLGAATGGPTDTYRIDGKVRLVLSYQGNPDHPSQTGWSGSSTKPPSVELWQRAHSADARYSIVLQGEVFRSPGSTRFSRPDPKKPFPAQAMLVDWVRVTSTTLGAADPDQ